MRDTVWTCADGRKLLVSQMETGPIINTIRRIQRLDWRKKYLSRLQLELRIRELGL